MHMNKKGREALGDYGPSGYVGDYVVIRCSNKEHFCFIKFQELKTDENIFLLF